MIWKRQNQLHVQTSASVFTTTSSLFMASPNQSFAELQRVHYATACLVFQSDFKNNRNLNGLQYYTIRSSNRTVLTNNAGVYCSWRQSILTPYLITIHNITHLTSYSLLYRCQPTQPSTSTNIGSRVFRSAGPKIWNSLASEIHIAQSFTLMCSKLKMHLCSLFMIPAAYTWFISLPRWLPSAWQISLFYSYHYDCYCDWDKHLCYQKCSILTDENEIQIYHKTVIKEELTLR